MLAMLAGNLVDGYTATISARETLAVPAGTAPAIVPGGVGSSVSGAAGVAAGSWIGIYGASLSAVTKALTTADLLSGSIPTTLGGIGVQSNGKAAYMQYKSATQLNVLAPVDSSAGNVAVTVSNSVKTSPSVISLLQAVLPDPRRSRGPYAGRGFPTARSSMGRLHRAWSSQVSSRLQTPSR